MRNAIGLGIVLLLILGIGTYYVYAHGQVSAMKSVQTVSDDQETSQETEYRALPTIEGAREISRSVTVNCITVVYEAGLLDGAKLRADMEQRGWSFEGGAGELVQLTFLKPGWKVLATQGIQDDKLRVSLCKR